MDFSIAPTTYSRGLTFFFLCTSYITTLYTVKNNNNNIGMGAARRVQRGVHAPPDFSIKRIKFKKNSVVLF